MSICFNVIYRHVNQLNGKSYIGMTIRTVMKRWKEHVSSALAVNNDGSYKSSFHFHKAIRKYGFECWTHEVLWEGNDCTREELAEMEIYYIEKYDSYNNGYNMTSGGDGGNSTSPEEKRAKRLTMRTKDTKNYYKVKGQNSYWVALGYLCKRLHFGYFKNEYDAKQRADYLMTLSDEDLVQAHREYKVNKKHGSSKNRSSNGVSYHFDKHKGKYRVVAVIEGKRKYFGQYTSKQDAIDKSKEVRLALKEGVI